MRVNEVFHTIQGEGRSTGQPTVFVRTTGCHLRCTWCDTTYSFYEGEEVPLPALLERIARWPARRVCLTGGEPLLQPDAADLVDALLRRGYEVVVETSGGVSVAALDRLTPRDRLVLSVDVKCPGSGMQGENRWDNLPVLRPHDQLKFVIADEADYAYAREVLAKHTTAAEPLFQACWTPCAETGGASNIRWLAERVLRDGLDVRVGAQLHKVIWGEERMR